MPSWRLSHPCLRHCNSQVSHPMPLAALYVRVDISAPRCFKIEESLQDLGIPVMHDDQHGTAIVVLAALINASKVVNKKIEDLKIVINGVGSAGTAIAKLLLCIGIDKKICTSVKEVILCDIKGIIYEGRDNLDKIKKE
ncbi:MAG: hypothetical protein IID61_17950, partial [SAR324 cluster bacterium]|nr:hypothetical protein [SAR324 cluster bacterium]